MSCLSAGDTAKNWGENIGFAIANMWGMGDFIKNATGTKTARSIAEIAKIENAISFTPSKEALKGSIPFSIFLVIFSI